VRKLEKNSSKQQKARDLYENSDKSVREIAEKLKVDEKTVRNWAKAGNWTRQSAEIPQTFRIGEAAARVVERLEQAAEPVEEPLAPASRTAGEIARDFCGTMDVLRAELDTVVRNLHLVREIVDANLDDASDKAAVARRKLVDKVLELPGLVKASNDLAAALARLADNGPGKKEEAADRAKAAGTGRFATPEAPKLGATTH
jgi:predicted transcriptional regulator